MIKKRLHYTDFIIINVLFILFLGLLIEHDENKQRWGAERWVLVLVWFPKVWFGFQNV